MLKIQITVNIILALLTCTACTEKHLARYSYQGTILTRIDSGTVTRFYLDDCATSTKPCSSTFLQTSYHGFDGAMSGYLVVLPNRRIEVVEVMGWFEQSDNDSIFSFRRQENPALIQWLDSVKNNARNVLYISSDLEEEKRTNTLYHSQVAAEYIR